MSRTSVATAVFFAALAAAQAEPSRAAGPLSAELPSESVPLGAFESLAGAVQLVASPRHLTVRYPETSNRDALLSEVARAAKQPRPQVWVQAASRRTCLLELAAPLSPTERAALGQELVASGVAEWVLEAGVLPNGEPLGVLPEVLVSTESLQTAAALAPAAEELGARLVSPLIGLTGGLWALPPSDSRQVFEAAAALGKLPGVRAAHPNFLRRKVLRLTLNDPLISQQWYLTRVQAQQAWDTTTGTSQTIVAVIDDGFDLSHEDLSGPNKLAPGGYDFAGDDNNPQGGGQDIHGTAVAGIAVATGNNGKGIAGLCPACRFLPIRQGNTDFDDVQAFGLAASQGAAVVNNSWGYYFPSQNVKNAITNAHTTGRGGLGTLVVFASGNEGVSIDQNQDISASPNALAVGASSPQDQVWGYSNYGTSLDVVAPADGQVTTDFTVGGYANGAYTGDFGGTSGAAPVVSGIVGLMASANPSLTAAELAQALFSSTDKVGSGYGANGKSVYYGFGRVNAAKAVAAAGGGAVEPDPDPDPDPAPGCGNVTFEGCCEGTTLQYCDGGQLQTASCAGAGCGWLAAEGYYDCGGSGADPSGANPLSCSGGGGPVNPGGNGDCAGFFACANECSTDACVEGCADDTQGAALDLAIDVMDCLDANGCYDEATQAAFEDCAAANCAAPLTACFGGGEEPDPGELADCEGFFDCAQECGDDACVEACVEGTSEAGLGLAFGVVDCLDTNGCYDEATDAGFAQCAEANCVSQLQACFGAGTGGGEAPGDDGGALTDEGGDEGSADEGSGDDGSGDDGSGDDGSGDDGSGDDGSGDDGSGDDGSGDDGSGDDGGGDDGSGDDGSGDDGGGAGSGEGSGDEGEGGAPIGSDDGGEESAGPLFPPGGVPVEDGGQEQPEVDNPNDAPQSSGGGCSTRGGGAGPLVAWLSAALALLGLRRRYGAESSVR